MLHQTIISDKAWDVKGEFSLVTLYFCIFEIICLYTSVIIFRKSQISIMWVINKVQFWKRIQQNINSNFFGCIALSKIFYFSKYVIILQSTFKWGGKNIYSWWLYQTTLMYFLRYPCFTPATTIVINAE